MLFSTLILSYYKKKYLVHTDLKPKLHPMKNSKILTEIHPGYFLNKERSISISPPISKKMMNKSIKIQSKIKLSA